MLNMNGQHLTGTKSENQHFYVVYVLENYWKFYREIAFLVGKSNIFHSFWILNFRQVVLEMLFFMKHQW